jgi:two-component system response regulator FixJ
MKHQRDLSVAGPIIVIDDDAAVRNSIKFSLEVEGFDVRTYSNPGEVLGAQELPASSCLIVDQNMPGMSGLNLLEALRKRGVRTPAILISGHVTAAMRAEARRGGIDVVEKPFLGNALIDSIRAAIAPRAAG